MAYLYWAEAPVFFLVADCGETSRLWLQVCLKTHAYGIWINTVNYVLYSLCPAISRPVYNTHIACAPVCMWCRINRIGAMEASPPACILLVFHSPNLELIVIVDMVCEAKIIHCMVVVQSCRWKYCWIASTEFCSLVILHCTHFRFKTSWLAKGYSKRTKIEQDLKLGKLTDAEAGILLGVHNYCNQLASRPSKLDIHLLTSVYYQVATCTCTDRHIQHSFGQFTLYLGFPKA